MSAGAAAHLSHKKITAHHARPWFAIDFPARCKEFSHAQPENLVLRSLLAFWSEFLRNPRCVGSIIPSGHSLGVAIANEILAENPGYVIELGAGTGSITHSLVAIRQHLAGLIVIEKSTKLADLLLQRYPNLSIKAGCASQLSSMEIPLPVPLTVVSSLPFRSLPPKDLAAIKGAIFALGRRTAGFRFIQYSYFGRVPFQNHTSLLAWERRRTVFANLPPATIWVLRDPAIRSLPVGC